ncbi:MAG: prepilin-type N-terminal cleavage/methylation domain-containing protein [Lachnospiraceae bacterium]|nr:prepilin-type N-terminal cleavage/methylation domain-containing protein [Lachnospiraceae bacterium]
MKKQNMNDKGFSLVELIIVIAIMAILIVVLAPQYLRYVEKSRVSSDQTTIVEYINAMQVLAADPDVTLTAGAADKYSIKNNTSNTITVSSDLSSLFVSQGMLDSTTAGGGKLQSTAYSTVSLDIRLVYDSTNKIWNVEAASGSGVEVSGQLATAGGTP